MRHRGSRVGALQVRGFVEGWVLKKTSRSRTRNE